MIWKEVIKNEPLRIGEEDSYNHYDATAVNVHPRVYANPTYRHGPAVVATCRLSRLLALQA